MRAFLAIFSATWFLNLFLPWWSVVIPGILFGAWLLHHPRTAFLTGFTAGGIAWLAHAVLIHIGNNGILTARIAELLQVGSPWLVLLITFLIGALPAGLATLTGFQLKTVLQTQPRAQSTDEMEY